MDIKPTPTRCTLKETIVYCVCASVKRFSPSQELTQLSIAANYALALSRQKKLTISDNTCK
jgi:hypothetical protein